MKSDWLAACARKLDDWIYSCGERIASREVIKVLGLFLFAAIWMLFVPGLIEYELGVFRDYDVQRKFEERYTKQIFGDKVLVNDREERYKVSHGADGVIKPEIAKSLTGFPVYYRWEKYEERRVELENRLEQTKMRLADISKVSPADWEILIKEEASLTEQLKNLSPPVKFRGFVPSTNAFSWLALARTLMFFSLGLHIILFRPLAYRERYPVHLHFVCIWVMMCVGTTLPSLLVGCFAKYQGRSVFADTDLDVSWPCFIVQLGWRMAVNFLLTFIWVRWLHAARPPKETGDPYCYATNRKNLDHLARQLVQWQMSSLALILAFAADFDFFYDRLFDDLHYAFQAVVIFALWIATWLITSAPLLRFYVTWNSAKTQAMAEIPTNSSKPEERKLMLKGLAEIEPYNWTHFLTTGLIGIISFLVSIGSRLFAGGDGGGAF